MNANIIIHDICFTNFYLIGLKSINPEYIPIGLFPFCTGCAAPWGVKAAPSIIFI